MSRAFLLAQLERIESERDRARDLAVALEQQVARVEALHFRRPWNVSLDSMTFGQIEFPDQCNLCRRTWPCATAVALNPEPLS